MARPVKPGRHSFAELKITCSKEYLENMYNKENLSIVQIAAKLATHRSIVTKLFEYYKIKKHSDKSSRNNFIASKIDYQQFRDFLNLHGACETWKHFGITRELFYSLCSEWNIDYKAISRKLSGCAKTKHTEINYCRIINSITEEKIKEYLIKYGYCHAICELKPQGMTRKIMDYFIREKFSDFSRTTNNYTNSYYNIKFVEFLKAKNIPFEQEFVIGMKRFDFKINNVLIEIDPISTHNLDGKGTIYGACGYYYHQNKSLLAIKNGYSIIHIYQWDSFDAIYNKLFNNVGRIEPEILYDKENHPISLTLNINGNVSEKAIFDQAARYKAELNIDDIYVKYDLNFCILNKLVKNNYIISEPKIIYFNALTNKIESNKKEINLLLSGEHSDKLYRLATAGTISWKL